MTKDVLIMMISFRIFNSDYTFSKNSWIIIQEWQFRLTHLGTLKLLSQYWLIWEYKDISYNVQMNIFYFKIKQNLFGKLSQLMDCLMVLYQPTFVGLFMDLKTNS